jgi:hypothetical protein
MMLFEKHIAFRFNTPEIFKEVGLENLAKIPIIAPRIELYVTELGTRRYLETFKRAYREKKRCAYSSMEIPA